MELSGTNYLELAEVQVLGSWATNLAQGKTAAESATYSTYVAGLAVDGNTDGVMSDGSMAIANYATNAWWQVDLGASAMVSSISVWARTDCCANFVSDYWVFVSDTPFNATDTPATLQNRPGTWSSHQTAAPSPWTRDCHGLSGAQGRYVRVQLTGTNYLELAEVQVFGAWVYESGLKEKTATESATYSTYAATAWQ